MVTATEMRRSITEPSNILVRWRVSIGSSFDEIFRRLPTIKLYQSANSILKRWLRQSPIRKRDKFAGKYVAKRSVGPQAICPTTAYIDAAIIVTDHVKSSWLNH